jgi:hypothetical protein
LETLVEGLGSDAAQAELRIIDMVMSLTLGAQSRLLRKAKAENAFTTSLHVLLPGSDTDSVL